MTTTIDAAGGENDAVVAGVVAPVLLTAAGVEASRVIATDAS